MPAEDSHRYAMLLSALPYHGPLFGARQTPLSRLRLRQRLELLDPADAECLRALIRLLDWTRQHPDLTDAELSARLIPSVAALSHPFAREQASWRLELRTLVAALRRRRRGQSAPSAGSRWGFGRWVGQIQRHWSEPGFRLEGAFPWLPEANRLLHQDDPLGLERLLLGVTWSHLERSGDGHHFDFAAVVLYTLRWDLIARWTAGDGEAAVARFDALAGQAGAGVDLAALLA